MSLNAKELLEEALRLPPDARARLASELLESLDDEDEGDVGAAWTAEIGRRAAELDAGRAKTISWSDARDQLRAVVTNPREG